MRCKVLGYEGRNDLIVYLTKLERESDDTKRFLENMRHEFDHVIIFISGEGDLENVIYRLIRDKQYDTSSVG